MNESIYMGNDLGIGIPCCTNRMGEMAQETIRKVGEVKMSETIITLCILRAAAIACIIGLIVIHFREKKIEKKTGEKPTYYSAVGDWLSGGRR